MRQTLTPQIQSAIHEAKLVAALDSLQDGKRLLAGLKDKLMLEAPGHKPYKVDLTKPGTQQKSSRLIRQPQKSIAKAKSFLRSASPTWSAIQSGNLQEESFPFSQRSPMKIGYAIFTNGK
jgi:hypothetical protein